MYLRYCVARDRFWATRAGKIKKTRTFHFGARTRPARIYVRLRTNIFRPADTLVSLVAYNWFRSHRAYGRKKIVRRHDARTLRPGRIGLVNTETFSRSGLDVFHSTSNTLAGKRLVRSANADSRYVERPGS